MDEQQKAFEFIFLRKQAIKDYTDRDLIKEYGRVIMRLAKRVDELELQLKDKS